MRQGIPVLKCRGQKAHIPLQSRSIVVNAGVMQDRLPKGEEIMSILYPLFVLFMPLILFGVIYKIKSLQTALVATGILLAGAVFLYLGLIYWLVNSMD